MAALKDGAAVRLFERSRFPRHKVCGEFLSPEVAHAFEALGCWSEFLALEPSRIRRATLHFGARQKRARFEEPAFGLSRRALDHFLFERARAMGADVALHKWTSEREVGAVVATGRRGPAPPGDRLFGFKAHFRGPVDDSVEMFFFEGGYAGVSAVEGGATNVCGLAHESALRACDFEFEEFLARRPGLGQRLRPLERATDWITTGPLVLAFGPEPPGAQRVYPAGDALGFLDPFTGAGVLNALLTGRMAGRAAARGLEPALYLRECRRVLARPFRMARLFRAVLASGWAHVLAAPAPAEWLFRWTRPRCELS